MWFWQDLVNISLSDLQILERERSNANIVTYYISDILPNSQIKAENVKKLSLRFSFYTWKEFSIVTIIVCHQTKRERIDEKSWNTNSTCHYSLRRWPSIR